MTLKESCRMNVNVADKKRTDYMTKHKNKIEKDHREIDKWDFMIANTFVTVLAIGLLIGAIVIMKMSY